MKSNRTILAIALDIAACAGVLLTAATPSIGAQEKAAASPAAAKKDDSGKQAGTSGKAGGTPGHPAPAMGRTADRPTDDSKKVEKRKAKKSKKAKKENRDDTGTQAGTSGRR